MEHSFNDKLKRPLIHLDWDNYGYWDKRRRTLALVLFGVLFIGAMVFVIPMFGGEAEQMQAVDETFTIN